MSLCLIAMFKNEESIMNEWLEHYLKEGVDKFFLINNNSNDNYLEVLNPYIANNIVELAHDLRKAPQAKSYNDHFLEKSKNYDWALVCDLDEFIYARKTFKTIKEYLHTLPNDISQVYVPWKLFGSNGYNSLDKQQPSKVVQSFTKRTNYNNEGDHVGIIKEPFGNYSFTKCIVRTKFLINLHIHNHVTSNKNYIRCDNTTSNYINQTIHPYESFCKTNEEILDNSFLHMNHYVIQSLDWFMRVKNKRGDSNSIEGDNVRNEKYFYDYDNVTNEIEDYELRDKN
jgi:hypothetical protein